MRYSTYEEPFPLNTPIPFLVSVENIGNAPANNINMTVMVGNKILGTSSIGSLSAVQGANLEIKIGAASGGAHKLTFSVNSKQTIPESNYNNNFVHSIFSWAGRNGICAYSFIPDDGEYSFNINTPKKFNFQVANFGSKTVENVQIGFIVNNTIIDLFNLSGEIPPGMAKNGSITIGFKTPGDRKIGIIVDPRSQITDPDRTDNIIIKAVYVKTGADKKISKEQENIVAYTKESYGILAALTFNSLYFEDYSVSGNTATYSHRNVYVGAELSREETECPISIFLTELSHRDTSGDKIINNFKMNTSEGYVPSDLYFVYNKENYDSISYPKDNNYKGIFFVNVRGDESTVIWLKNLYF